MENQPETDKSSGIQGKQDNRQVLKQQILQAFQDKQFKKTLALAKMYSATYPNDKELTEIINDATEVLTAEHFINQCEKDLINFCKEGKRNKAYIMLQKIEKMNPHYEKLPELKQLVTNTFAEETLRKKKLDPHESLENLLEEGLIYFYQQKYFDAAQRFQTILNINPHHLKAKNLLDECQGNIKGNENIKENASEEAIHENILGPIIEDFLDFQDDDDKPHDKQEAEEKINDTPRILDLEKAEEVIIDAKNNPNEVEKLNSIFSFNALSEEQKNHHSRKISATTPKSEPKEELDGQYKLNFFTLILIFITIFATVWLFIWGTAKYKMYQIAKENSIISLTREGMEAIENDDFDKARQLWTEALKKSPENQKLQTLIDNSYVLEKKRRSEITKLHNGYINEAERFIDLKNFEKAQYYIGLVEQENPNHESLPAIKEKLNLELSNLEYQKKQVEKNLRKKVRTLLQEADIYMQNEEYDKAKKKVNEILRLDRTNSIATALLKQILEKERKTK